MLGQKIAESLEIEAQYAVYMDRQSRDAALLRVEEARLIPDSADFESLSGLSNELRHKLKTRQPATLADVQKIDGMTPAALSLIMLEIRKAESQARGAA